MTSFKHGLFSDNIQKDMLVYCFDVTAGKSTWQMRTVVQAYRQRCWSLHATASVQLSRKEPLPSFSPSPFLADHARSLPNRQHTEVVVSILQGPRLCSLRWWRPFSSLAPWQQHRTEYPARAWSDEEQGTFSSESMGDLKSSDGLQTRDKDPQHSPCVLLNRFFLTKVTIWQKRPKVGSPCSRDWPRSLLFFEGSSI